MSDDVFNTDDQGDNQDQNYLKELVGPDKKFKTVEDLAKGKAEADVFIAKLQEENQEARDALKKAEEAGESKESIAELIKALREGQNSDDTGDNQTLTTEELESKVKSILQGETRKATADENRRKGNELVLQKTKGDVDAAKAYVAERAKQLGMTGKELAELSERSPEAFAKLIDIDPSTTQGGITNVDGVNTDALSSNNTVEEVDGHKTKAYYDKLKKEMGIRAYLSDLNLQQQYLKDAMALGDERFNNQKS